MIFNLSETNVGGGSAQNVTLTIVDSLGAVQNVYVPSNATWTGIMPDMETYELKGVLTIPQNSMFMLVIMAGRIVSSVVTSEKINTDSERKNGYAVYVGTSDGTIEISI